MKVIVTKNYEESSRVVADLIEEVVRNNPHARLGLATGGTPEKTYDYLAEDCAAGKISFKDVNTVNLDEYIGITQDNSQSYRRFMNEHLFNRIDIDINNTFVANGMNNPEDEIKLFNERLVQQEIDLQLLGVGVSGHVGFNEGRDYLVAGVHTEELDESTIEANSRYFESKEDVPTSAMTMGVGDIMKAKKVVLIASGLSKVHAIRELVTNDKITTQVPCTILKMHPDSIVVIDEELANAVGYKY